MSALKQSAVNVEIRVQLEGGLADYLDGFAKEKCLKNRGAALAFLLRQEQRRQERAAATRRCRARKQSTSGT